MKTLRPWGDSRIRGALGSTWKECLEEPLSFRRVVAMGAMASLTLAVALASSSWRPGRPAVPQDRRTEAASLTVPLTWGLTLRESPGGPAVGRAGSITIPGIGEEKVHGVTVDSLPGTGSGDPWRPVSI